MLLMPTATRMHTAAPTTNTPTHAAYHTKLADRNLVFVFDLTNAIQFGVLVTGGTPRTFSVCCELSVSCAAVFLHNSLWNTKYMIDPPAPVAVLMRLWLLGESHQLTDVHWILIEKCVLC